MMVLSVRLCYSIFILKGMKMVVVISGTPAIMGKTENEMQWE